MSWLWSEQVRYHLSGGTILSSTVVMHTEFSVSRKVWKERLLLVRTQPWSRREGKDGWRYVVTTVYSHVAVLLCLFLFCCKIVRLYFAHFLLESWCSPCMVSKKKIISVDWKMKDYSQGGEWKMERKPSFKMKFSCFFFKILLSYNNFLYEKR